MSDKLSKEILTIKTEAEQEAINRTKELLKVYRRNLDDVTSQIANIYLEYTVDGVLNISTKQRYTVLLQLQKQLAEQSKVLGETNVKITTNILTDIYSDTYYKSAYYLERGMGIAGSFALLKPEFVKAAIERPINGEDFSSRIWKNTDKLAVRVKLDVEKALIQGISPEKLARIIQSDYGSSAYSAKRLIFTETAKSVTLAQDESYQNSGVVDKVLFDATLDNKTSEICQELDGKTFPLDDHPDVPQHPNCRSCIVPVLSGWTPTKKKENIKDPITGEKKIIDYATYEKWKESRF